MLKKNEDAADTLKTSADTSAGGHPLLSSLTRGMAQLLVMIGVIFGGVFGMNYLTDLKEAPPKRAPFQTVYTVESVIAERGSFQPNLLVYGEVQASRSVELRSLVAGKVVEVNPELKIGARIEAGTELFKIDPFSFEMELGSAKANLEETSARIAENQARIEIEESRIRSLREQLELAESDLNRITALRKNGTATAKQVEDRKLIVSQRSQSLEQSELNLVAERSRLEQLEAIGDRYDWAHKQAQRNLNDTTLQAPMTGVVSQKNIDVGRLINANDVVVSLYEADQLEVRFTLTDERFGRIQSDPVGVTGRKVEVIWSVGGEEFRFPAEIDRIGAQITSNRGGVEVIAIVERNLSNSAIRPGAFVEVIVPDKSFDDHFRIPETALYENDTIYLIRNGKLVAVSAVTHARDGDHIIVSGDLSDGDEVLVTRIAEISEGLRVRSPDSVEKGEPEADKLAGASQ